MIHLISGDYNKRKSYITALVKKNNIELTNVEHINILDVQSEGALFSRAVAQRGLFSEQHLYVLSDMLSDFDVNTLLDHYQSTDHIVVFSEEKVNKKISTLFKEAQAEVQVFQSFAPKKSFGAIFKLADLLGARNKKALWIEYMKQSADASPEEIIGVMVWGLRNISLVQHSSSQPKGMKDFVYKKNQRYAQNYRPEEIAHLMRAFIHAFHRRKTNDSVSLHIERIILEIA